MHEIAKKHRVEIEEYCVQNGLSADKLFSSSCSASKKDIYILGPGDPERGKLGLADHIPLPIALIIYFGDGELRFEQTEHTHMLREYETAAQMAYTGV